MAAENSREIKDVNIEFGDDVSRMLYEAARQTYENRPGAVVEMHESFSGLRAIRPNYKPSDCFESMGSDGIGTKVEVAERTQDHSTIAFDLLAMACDDAVVRGAEPIAINTVLDVNQLLENDALTDKAIREIAIGYVAACKAAGVVILNGETAELGNRVNGYGNFNYNWCATVLWYAQKDRLLTGHRVRPGDVLIGLAEEGFRSNGITDVRKGMLREYGPDWHDEMAPELGSVSLGMLVQQPSTIYSRFISELTGGFDINKPPKAKVTGVAHITGGGQPSKLRRMLEPSGCGVTIDDPIEPPRIMKHAQNLSMLTDREAYGKWHMGPGMIVATNDPETVLDEARSYGITAKDIGLVENHGEIRIMNRGDRQQEEWLVF
jgi:phosphoribosylformylglycinamidine cyclo-ligase